MPMLTQTWVKFSGLSGYGGGGILQLVGCCGTGAIHVVGGHVRPVRGGGIILSVLVLAKRRIWGIILRKITRIMITRRHTKQTKRNRETEMFSWKDQSDFWGQILQVFPLMSLIFCPCLSVFYISETIKTSCCCFLQTQWRWTLFMSQFSKPVTTSISRSP